MQLTWGDNFAGHDLHGQPPIVKVLNIDCSSRERCQKVDLSVVDEIIALALKARVRLLLNLELHVTRLYTGHLVAFSTEIDLGAGLDATVDVNMENFALDNRLLAVALLALVLFAHDLSLTITVRADCLEALDHGAHLTHHHLHSLTITA